MHELVQVAAGRLGGVGEEGIVKVHAQGLGQVVVTERNAALCTERGKIEEESRVEGERGRDSDRQTGKGGRMGRQEREGGEEN